MLLHLSPKRPVRWVSLQSETVENVKRIVEQSKGKYKSVPDYIRKTTEKALQSFDPNSVYVLPKPLLDEIVAILKIAPGFKTPQRFVELACKSYLLDWKDTVEEC